MAFVDRYQRRLREYRTLLNLLRTPKFRTLIASALGSEQMSAAPLLDAPLNQISWLNCTRDESAHLLARTKSDVEDLMAGESILLCERISVMPQNAERREQIIRAVFMRIFEYSSRSWLSEAELNAKLSMLVEDVVDIRRYGVDNRIIMRTADGKRYWLAKRPVNALADSSNAASNNQL
ncbi:MAG: DUF2087 domain-containing protein [Bifidobacterium sp.]|jgi:hypothetical protein|nr:DUF2087 domain-containing protein [Bifidobacterium sp.]